MEITEIQSLYANHTWVHKGKPAQKEVPIRPTIDEQDYFKAKERTLWDNEKIRSDQISVNKPPEKIEDTDISEVPFRSTLDMEAYREAKERTVLDNENTRSDHISVNKPPEKIEDTDTSEVPFRSTLDMEAYREAKEITVLDNEISVRKLQLKV
jgi:hypothetical protein